MAEPGAFFRGFCYPDATHPCSVCSGQQAAKRGGRAIQVSLSEAADVATQDTTDLVALDDALNTLEKLDPRQARTVELRFFGGLSLEEVAEVLPVSVSSVRSDWRMAQAWLHQQLAAST